MTPNISPQIFNRDCLGLYTHEEKPLEENSVHALITDPPYGINFKHNAWDNSKNGKVEVPNRQIWEDCFRVLRPGGYGLVFSFPRVMHRVMVALEEVGFEIKDVLFWVYLNGMPKTTNIGLEIDKMLGQESNPTKAYKYKQGYEKEGAKTYRLKKEKYRLEPTSELGQKYNGAGVNLKPTYEPIILIKKPIEKGLTIAQNIQKYDTGALNLEATRIPYAQGEEGKVGHNPHPKGRVAANLVGAWADSNEVSYQKGYNRYFLPQQSPIDMDDYETAFFNALDRSFFVPKVRQKAEYFNIHPTLKPTQLMKHLITLVSFEGQTILDPFMGSGSTGVACQYSKRHFIGYEKEKEYFEIAEKRIRFAAEQNNILF